MLRYTTNSADRIYAVKVTLCAVVCRLSPALLDELWLQQHEARLVQQLQRDGWTGRNSNSSSRSSRAAPGAKPQPAGKPDKQLQASVRSAAAAGLSPRGASALLSLHEQCGYGTRNAGLRQVCLQMAASVLS
jgi:hypothetical protein